MAEQPSRPGNGPEPKKPSFRAQAAKSLSQLALTFYVLLLIVGLVASMVPNPARRVLSADGGCHHRRDDPSTLLTLLGIRFLYRMAKKPFARRAPSAAVPVHTGD